MCVCIYYIFFIHSSISGYGVSFTRSPPSCSKHFWTPHLLIPSPWRLGFNIRVWGIPSIALSFPISPSFHPSLTTLPGSRQDPRLPWQGSPALGRSFLHGPKLDDNGQLQIQRDGIYRLHIQVTLANCSSSTWTAEPQRATLTVAICSPAAHSISLLRLSFHRGGCWVASQRLTFLARGDILCTNLTLPLLPSRNADETFFGIQWVHPWPWHFLAQVFKYTFFSLSFFSCSLFLSLSFSFFFFIFVSFFPCLLFFLFSFALFLFLFLPFLFLLFLFFFFSPHFITCEILVPQPNMEFTPLAFEGQSFNP